jgi:hypothetical protein
MDPRCIQRYQGDPGAKLIMLVRVEGDDVQRLDRIADARGLTPSEVIAGLLRDADATS